MSSPSKKLSKPLPKLPPRVRYSSQSVSPPQYQPRSQSQTQPQPQPKLPIKVDYGEITSGARMDRENMKEFAERERKKNMQISQMNQLTLDDLNQNMPKYKFIKVLGQGAFGKAFLAENKNGDKVVVKLVSRYKDYIREVLCLKRVIELNLCGKEFLCYIGDDTFEINGYKFYLIITEYNEGYITVNDFMAKIELYVSEKIYDKINELDERLMNSGIKHNDLHLGNVLIDLKKFEFDLKVIDFGLCVYEPTPEEEKLMK
jgi:serine/threonine protein kinase